MSHTTRVVVGVDDSPESWTTLRRAAAAARHRRALLVPVIAWTPTGGELLYRARPCRPLELEWERRAYAQLDDIITDTLGPEETVLVKPQAVRAESLAQAVTAVATQPGDMVFTPPRRPRAWERLGLRLHRRPDRGMAVAH